MGKKLVSIILGVGAIIAIALAIMYAIKISKVKMQMEQTLNQKMEQFAKDFTFIQSFEPFTCSGLMSVGCYSKSMLIGDELTQFNLHDVGIDINSITQHSLKIALNIHKIEPEVNEQTQEELDKVTLSFLPSKVQCKVALHTQGEKLDENIACNILAHNAKYEISGGSAFLHEKFKEQNIKEILEDFYLKMLLDDELDNGYLGYKDVKYSLKDFKLTTQDKGFSKDIYTYYKLQNYPDDIPAATIKEGFEQFATNTKQLFLISAQLTLGDVYKDELMQFGNALESFLLGKTHNLGLNIKRKNDKETFIVLDDFLTNPELKTFAQNYDLEVLSH